MSARALFVILFILGFWIVVGGLIGRAIGASKGQAVAGFWLGALLGWVGWIIVAVIEPSDAERRRRHHAMAEVFANSVGTRPNMTTPLGHAADNDRSPTERACPWCAELIKPAAIVCRYCGRDVDRWVPDPVSPPPVAYTPMVSPSADEIERRREAAAAEWARRNALDIKAKKQSRASGPWRPY